MQAGTTTLGPGAAAKGPRGVASTAPALSLRNLTGFCSRGITLLLFAATSLLLWRRVSGVLTPPAEVEVATAALLFVMSLVTARWMYRSWQFRRERAAGRGYAVLLSGMALFFGGALTFSGSSPLGWVLLWGPLAVEEIWAWTFTFNRGFPIVWRTGFAAVDRVPAELAASTSTDPIVTSDRPPTGDVLQQLTRSESADGVDRLSGWLRAPLEPNQRVANLHVAFCPPFRCTPKATVEQVDGPAARMKTVEVMPYGGRFDWKLIDCPSEQADSSPKSILVRFQAEAGPATAGDEKGIG